MEVVATKASFPKYPAYKDSGDKWLMEIPKNWNALSLKAVLAERKEKNDPIKTKEILSLSMHHGVTKYSDKGRGGNKAKEDLTAYKLARPNDIVLNSMNVIVGSVGLSKYFGAISPVYYALYARNEKVDINFYNYLFQNPSFQMSLFPLGNGILIKKSESSNKLNTIRLKIPMDKLNRVVIPVPSIAEQIAIANFLEDKTAKIDKAIAQKERMIDLLKERKQIIIQNAVTKGLNPNVKLKDSGVEWIGEIPEGWGVKRLKYVLKERSERSATGDEPLLMMSQVHGLVVRSEFHDKAEVAASSVGNKLVHSGDLVFNKLKAHLGVFFKSTIDFKGIVSPDYAVYYSNGLIQDVKYLELLFRHPIYIGQFIIRATGVAEGLIRLYTGDLFEIPIPIPAKEEQTEILAFIETYSSKMDLIITSNQTQIEKLKEYKATLIDSAVTGKIKVG